MRGSVEGDAAREAAATYCTYTHERRFIGCCTLAAHFHRMGENGGRENIETLRRGGRLPSRVREAKMGLDEGGRERERLRKDREVIGKKEGGGRGRI